MTLGSPDPVMIETLRLRLRLPQPADADFIIELLNDESFLRFIGDRGVRNTADAQRYMDDVARSHREHGHGLMLVEVKESGASAGLCGVMRKDWLPAPDLAYAFLAGFRGRGYAQETAAATVTHARDRLRMPRLVAAVDPGNEASARLLVKLGFTSAGSVVDPATPTPLDLYAIDLQ